jgi:RHS repeat-associated protein
MVASIHEFVPLRTLTYDANGNLTNDGNGKTYAYDAVNRLVSVTQGGTVTGFVYDGHDHRVQETSNGAVVKQWVWCDGLQPCEERDASNNVTKRFYWRGEQINGTNYYYTRDHQGSVREMTDNSGSLVARYDYDPFGRRTLVSGTDLADFGFTGFYYDQATGLYFSRTRVYSPDLARWLTRDTIGEAGGINLYQYVRNNPINFFDPFGLWEIGPQYPINAPANQQYGTVLTDGAGGLKIILPPFPGAENYPDIMPVLTESASIHEQSHLDDILKENPNIAKNQPANRQVVASCPAQRFQSEIDATTKQLKYLDDVINNPKQYNLDSQDIEALEGYRNNIQGYQNLMRNLLNQVTKK